MTQKFEAFIGLCIVLCAFSFLLILSQTSAFSLSHKHYIVNAYFNDISGVTIGSDVKMSGVKIGSVSETALNAQDYRAQIKLSLNNNIQLPTDSVVKIASDSLLGGASINIEAGFESEFIKPNGTITNTQSSVSLMSLISKAIFSAGRD